MEPASAGPMPAASSSSYIELVDDATRALINSLAGEIPGADYDMGDVERQSPEPQSVYRPLEGWGVYQTYGDTRANLSQEEEGTRLLMKSLRDRFDELSVDESAERSDPDDDPVAEPNTGGE